MPWENGKRKWKLEFHFPILKKNGKRKFDFWTRIEIYKLQSTSLTVIPETRRFDILLGYCPSTWFRKHAPAVLL